MTLTGNLHRQLGKDNYEFHDKSGSLVLNIAPAGWLEPIFPPMLSFS